MRNPGEEELRSRRELEIVGLHRRYSSAFCKTLLYRSALILNPYLMALLRYGLTSEIMRLPFKSNRIPIVPITWSFIDCATVLALLSSSRMASADISEASTIASASPLPKNSESADTARALSTRFFSINPDFKPSKTSTAPVLPLALSILL